MTKKSLCIAMLCLFLAVSGCASRDAEPVVSTPPAASESAPPAADQPLDLAETAHKVPATLVADTQSVNPIDGNRAYGYLQNICALGPRVSGTPAMTRQQQILQAHFQQQGATVEKQEFTVNHPLTKQPTKLANLIVTWHPDRKQRVLMCAHYDTRPLPDRDPNPRQRRSGTFIGANDGASGVALLMELGHLMPHFEGDVGVDFVLFDGEELVYVDGRDDYFIGSTHFANEYRDNPPGHTYLRGVLLDMVGDADLQLYYEAHSHRWRDTRPLLHEIWSTAQRLGVKEFVPRVGHEVRDDHLPLRNTAKIPTCDIIDFDYPYWHTTEDLPRRCSGASLAKVGWVVHEWLRTTKHE